MTDIDNDEAASKALTPVAASQLTNYEAEIQYAQLMAKAQLLPAHLRGNPGNCLAVITMAQSWNMNPIMVGLKTSVIPKKGGGETLMFEGQLVNAAINRSPYLQSRLKFELSGEGANTVCIVRGRLKGESEDRTVTVGMPKTQNSPLWSGNQGDKEQQLTYLGARVWCRRHLPEILLGVYTPEDDWTEREDDRVTERRNSVASRVAALEHAPSAPTGIPDKDDFIEGDAVTVGPANVPGGVLSTKAGTVPGAQTEGLPLAGRQIADNPEDRKPPEDDLDEPIPDFGAKTVSCETCGDRGLLENADGDKEPCPDCKS